MRRAIGEVEIANRTLGIDTWSCDVKATDRVLDPIFRRYFEITKQPLLFRKADYHELVRHISDQDVDSEVLVKLDRILFVAESARPRDH